MELVTREAAGVDVGDLLEAKVERGKITFSSKSVVDRHLAEGLADLKMGRSHGPYVSAKEAIARIGIASKDETQAPVRIRFS